ncbi:MAG: leucine-rich repeat domain-containing protein [Candidatus Thorarchaeota archaeon]|jgi:Leucine-rich repeat (LRR) protein
MNDEELWERIHQLLYDLRDNYALVSFSEKWLEENDVNPLVMQNLNRIVHGAISHLHYEADFEIWSDEEERKKKTGITYKAIENALKNPSLERLNLEWGSLEGLDFRPLMQLENLKHIQISNITPLTGLSNLLSNTPNLEKLSIIGAGPFSTALLNEIASLGSLRDLYIPYCSGFEETSLAPLGSCTTLERITLDSLKMTSIDLKFTSGLANLEKISLEKNEITVCDLGPLAHNMNLRELSLDDNKIESLDLTPLSSCRRFSILRLMSNKLKELDLTPLAQCDMTELVVTGNRLQRIDLEPLVECSNLKTLLLFENRLDDIDLWPLSKCKNLTYLNLSYNQLRSVDLTPLFHCIALKQLRIRENRLTEVDLSPLVEGKELKELHLQGNKIKDLDTSPLKGIRHYIDIRW